MLNVKCNNAVTHFMFFLHLIDLLTNDTATSVDNDGYNNNGTVTMQGYLEKYTSEGMRSYSGIFSLWQKRYVVLQVSAHK